MKNIDDNISEIRQQINIIHKLVRKAGLYISLMDNEKVDTFIHKAKLKAIRESLKLIEDELIAYP